MKIRSAGAIIAAACILIPTQSAVATPADPAGYIAQQSSRQVQPARISRVPISQATPHNRRVYETAHGFAAQRHPQPYTCEHGGGAVTCWCNWGEDASDCKDMILANPCGDDATYWTSDVEGEYGCDGTPGG